MKQNIKFLMFACGSIVMAAVTFNLSKKMNISNGRDVASFTERDSSHQINWEQNLAKELSNGKQASLPTMKIGWKDEMMFEFFKGQYAFHYFPNGEIQKIKLQNSQEGILFNSEDFFKKFAPSLNANSQFKVISDTSNKTLIEFNLVSGKSRQMTIEKNANGHAVEVQFE